ncbi:MAG TPA: PhnD/SsuA/transferrin family substrate-binding protein [bacterium]|nr:PhnD/SsuA/transferrin family substrate-binding protein [bacterium]
MKRLVAISFLLLCVVFLQQTARSESKTYKIIVPGTYTISGKSKSQMQTFTEEIVAALSNVLGEKIEMVYSPKIEEAYIKDAITQLVSHKVDLVGFSGDWYAKMSPQMREKFLPLLVLVINGKKNTNYCLYVRKSDGITKVDQLRGKRLSTYVYKDVRYLLYKAGIDQPLEKFFGEVLYQTVLPLDLMKMLTDEKIDAFVSSDYQVDLSRGIDPAFKNIVPVQCAEYTLNPFFLYSKDLDPEVVDKVKKAMVSWKTDKRFQKLKLFFVAIKGGVSDVKPEDLNTSIEVDKLIVSKGWETERKEFIKRHSK